MEARKGIVCGLPAFGRKPQLKQHTQEPQHQQHPQQQAQEEEDDVVEISRAEFRRSQGYLTRVEEPEEDIDPMFRGVVKIRMENARKSTKRPKQEQGQSSRGKAKRVD